jgi:hypothetical protein
MLDVAAQFAASHRHKVLSSPAAPSFLVPRDLTLELGPPGVVSRMYLTAERTDVRLPRGVSRAPALITSIAESTPKPSRAMLPAKAPHRSPPRPRPRSSPR